MRKLVKVLFPACVNFVVGCAIAVHVGVSVSVCVECALTLAAGWTWEHGTAADATLGQGPVSLPLPPAPLQLATPKTFQLYYITYYNDYTHSIKRH